MTTTMPVSAADPVFADSVTRLLDRSCPYQRIADTEASTDGYDTALWSKLTGLGWTTFFAGETGFDRSSLPPLALLLSELGRRGAALPLLQTAMATVLASAPGLTATGRSLLGGIGYGEHPVAVVGADFGSRIHADLEGDGVRLASPALPATEWLQEARTIVVPLHVRTGRRAAVLPVALPAADSRILRITPVGTLDNERAARAVLTEDALIGSDCWLAAEPVGQRRWRSMLVLACLLRAAELTGLGRGMLDLVLQHVRRREVFGRPLARFQAVQHMCADAATRLRSATLLTAEAVELASTDRDFERTAATAIYTTGRAVAGLALTAAQLHGGIGFTAEFPLNVYFRRAKAQQMRSGSLTDQVDEIGRWLPAAGHWWSLHPGSTAPPWAGGN